MLSFLLSIVDKLAVTGGEGGGHQSYEKFITTAEKRIKSTASLLK
jgi:hypothetical protein